jgi:hypothetical protein
MATIKFESTKCSRCHGSGSYSWCQMYGNRCFGCAGSGTTLTKRGVAARAFLHASQHSEAQDIKAGWRVAADGLKTKGGNMWVTVRSVDLVPDTIIRDNEEPKGYMVKADVGGMIFFWNLKTEVRTVRDQEHLSETIEAAMVYQDNLTKAGTPRKRRVAS